MADLGSDVCPYGNLVELPAPLPIDGNYNQGRAGEGPRKPQNIESFFNNLNRTRVSRIQNAVIQMCLPFVNNHFLWDS